MRLLLINIFCWSVCVLTQTPPKFPNIDYLGAGYDVLYGNPQNVGTSTDPGFRAKVYNLTYSGQETDDGTYQIPDGTGVFQCTDCLWAFSVDKISGVQTYSESISTSVTVDYSGIIMAFGFSSTYQYMLKAESSEAHFYTKALAICTAYCASVENYTPPPFTQNFIAGVQAIPTILDDDANLEWIGEFGTHVLKKATMGGIFGELAEFNRESWAEMENQEQSSSFSISAAASYSSIEVAGGYSTLTTEQQTQAQLFRNLSYSRGTIAFGGPPPSNGNASAWEQNVIAKPMPISWALLDITSLLTPSNFPNISVTDLTAKQENLRSTIANYCKLLMAQGKTSTCTPPPDPPLPPPAKACYQKTTQYGGTGGSVYDDGYPQTQSSIITTVKIDVRCADYLDFIQLTVSDGISSWPLKPHGGTGGNPATFLVPPGDYIIRVLLWIGNYVNAIQFVTAQGTQSNIYGNPYKNPTTQYVLNFNTTARQNPVSVFGRSGGYVDAIGFYVENPC